METQQTFRYEFITPARAAELLSRLHPRQRRAGPQKVGAYARTLADGRWNDHVPQPVMLSPDGLLLNGGHRLTAIVKSGIGATLLVAYDVPEDVFDVIDTGAIRRPQQFVAGQLAVQQAACARWVLWAERRFERAPSSSALTFDLDEVVGFIDMNTTEIVSAVVAAKAVNATSKVPIGLHAAVLILAERAGADPDRLASWVEGVTTGAKLPEGDPRLAIRTRFLMPGKGRAHAPFHVNWHVVVTALNAHLHGDLYERAQATSGVTWPAVGESAADYRRRAGTANVRRAKARRRKAAASNGVTVAHAERMAAGAG